MAGGNCKTGLCLGRTPQRICKAHKEIRKCDREQLPDKTFFCGQVFRNESIDYRHLAELYQTDGIIIGNNLTFESDRHAETLLLAAGNGGEG